MKTSGKVLLCVALFLAAVLPCLADDGSKLPGTWKLVSSEAEIQATGQKEPAMGKNATGFVIFTPERVFFILTGEGRQPAKDDHGRAALMNSLISYTGLYRLKGDSWTTRVDVAWDPEIVGTDQTRFFRIDGDRLEVTTTWAVHPNWPEKGMLRGVLTFERAR